MSVSTQKKGWKWKKEFSSKFQKFGIEVCQLATLFLCRLEIAAAELQPLFRHKG